ncbi:mitochondrial genome maintenance MGM101, partial [Ascobolus immersus RN42]
SSSSSTVPAKAATATPTTSSSTNSTSTITSKPKPISDLLDSPPLPLPSDAPSATNWSHSFHGLSTTPFPPEVAQILLAPLVPQDVEIKPDGIIYLPEIKYRRILNQAFGPGGWGLAPRGETIITQKLVTREYALVCHGRLVSVARGEQQYFDNDGIPTATEGCKSNALVRCCKDLGVASELWDPRFISKWKKEFAKEVWATQGSTGRKRKIWVRKGDDL